jgi:Fe2+ or Zn2+ uptake regulation protein
VCVQCGMIEDVDACSIEGIEKRIMQHSRSFNSIQSHTLEFFGLCRACERRRI